MSDSSKQAYIAAVDAAYISGKTDAQFGSARDQSKIDPRLRGAYLSGFDLVLVDGIVKPFVLQAASEGYDDGFGKKEKRTPTMPGQVVASDLMTADFKRVYIEAYNVGVEVHAAENPPKPVDPNVPGPVGPTDPGTPGPGVTGPAATTQPVDNTGWWVAGILAVGVAAAASAYKYGAKQAGPAGPKRTALAANPTLNAKEMDALLLVEEKTEGTKEYIGGAWVGSLDGSKPGNPVNERVARKLENMGLIKIHDEPHTAGWRKARITEAGRQTIRDSLDAEGKVKPFSQVMPGHVWIQGIGWVPAKPAGELVVGDVMMWNSGETSTVEHIEQTSAQFLTVLERYEDGKRSSRKMKIDRLVALAHGRNPTMGKKFVLVLDNLDQEEEGTVVITVKGRGAAAWAKDDQSVAGARWETDGPDFAYAMPLDHPGLVEELENDGYELNLDEYSPP